MMLERLSIGASATLTLIFIASILYAPTQNTDPKLLYASYAERFQSSQGTYIEWVLPSELPQLTESVDAIVHGTVIREVAKPAWLSYLDQVFEVKVQSYLKTPEYPAPRTILISQFVGEHGNPVVRAGDECVFFLRIINEQDSKLGVIYGLGGDYTRYIVYGGRVYSVASLNPDYSSQDSLVRGELLSRFLVRVEDLVK